MLMWRRTDVLNCKSIIGQKTFDLCSVVRCFHNVFRLSPFMTHIHLRKFCSETESGYVAVKQRVNLLVI